MDVHLVDGTYELFRHHFAVPSHVTDDGREVAAARAVVGSLLMMLEDGATHVGVATDKVIESFRNDLWPGYKDGSGIEPALLSQFPVLEDALEAAGFAVFAMVDHEADDALASLARVAAADDRVDRVLIATPDKDLAQCVVEGRVWQYDRRKRAMIGVDEVVEKFGVPPESIPDWLALVGDSADGFPGLPGWGAKSAATVLARWGHIDDIPADPADWDVTVRSAARLAEALAAGRDDARLFRTLAVLVDDCPTITSVDELQWTGPAENADAVLGAIDGPGLAERARALAARRA
ncbi:MAG: 5'-3' exonuclease [Acidimicrobiales bacterium]